MAQVVNPRVPGLKAWPASRHIAHAKKTNALGYALYKMYLTKKHVSFTPWLASNQCMMHNYFDSYYHCNQSLSRIHYTMLYTFPVLRIIIPFFTLNINKNMLKPSVNGSKFYQNSLRPRRRERKGLIAPVDLNGSHKVLLSSHRNSALHPGQKKQLDNALQYITPAF